MKTIHITSQDELPQVAGAIIGSLGRRTVVAFRGEMGAGKTTLIREIAAELGAADTVTSPTFAIVNQYKGEGNRRIHHFDFYVFTGLFVVVKQRATAHLSTTSISTASTTCGKPSTSVTRSISTRETCVWWSGPRRSNSCCPTTR